jgi:hypothetical protein
MLKDDLTYLRFDIQGLGQKFSAAIAAHVSDFDKTIQASLNQLIQEGELDRIVYQQVREALPVAVKNALHSYQVQKKLEEIILDSLNVNEKGK